MAAFFSPVRPKACPRFNILFEIQGFALYSLTALWGPSHGRPIYPIMTHATITPRLWQSGFSQEGREKSKTRTGRVGERQPGERPLWRERKKREREKSEPRTASCPCPRPCFHSLTTLLPCVLFFPHHPCQLIQPLLRTRYSSQHLFEGFVFSDPARWER